MMEFRILCVVSVLQLVLMSTMSTVIPNLRRHRVETTIGRFVAPRDKLEALIEDRKAEDNQCGNYVNLSLATSLPSAHYDESRYGELSIAFGTIEETNLDYLPCDLKDKLETSYRSLFFGIPYLSNGNHGILHLLEMTEAKNRLTLPTATNDDYRITLDSIDEDGETVTLRIRNDTMTLDVVKNTCCQTDKDVGDDFDGLMGVNVTFTCYPKTFDWNCGSVLDWNTGYCGVLKDKLCEYQRFGGDVCVQATTKSSVRCSSRMKLTSASGVFGDILSGFFDSFPVKSFEAEWINRDHESGIKYPCLSK